MQINNTGRNSGESFLATEGKAVIANAEGCLRSSNGMMMYRVTHNGKSYPGLSSRDVDNLLKELGVSEFDCDIERWVKNFGWVM